MKIEFVPYSEGAELNVPMPQPSKKYMPKWYKNMPPYEEEKFIKMKLKGNVMSTNATAKSCMPFFDTFATGYIQETWCDILISNDGHTISYHWADGPQPLEIRPRTKNAVPIPEEFYQIEFEWRTQWEPKTPKGWSSLYMHPLNHFHLPFFSFSGIVDTDRFHMGGAFPFFIKRGFSGVIPAGTPMYQIIPFQRKSWNSFAEKFDEGLWRKRHFSTTKYFTNGYKKHFWNKKDYS
jgi:hypothetical protein